MRGCVGLLAVLAETLLVERIYYQQIAVISAKEIPELQEIRERSVLQI